MKSHQKVPPVKIVCVGKSKHIPCPVHIKHHITQKGNFLAFLYKIDEESMLYSVKKQKLPGFFIIAF